MFFMFNGMLIDIVIDQTRWTGKEFITYINTEGAKHGEDVNSLHQEVQRMKKLWLAVAVVAVMGMTSYQIADARMGGGGGMGGQGYGMQRGQAMDEAAMQARESFFKETVELRKQIVQKRAEMTAIMAHETPDSQKISRLAGELFDLRNQMQAEAKAKGLARGFGGGMMMGQRFCDGSGGRGMGRGCGQHHGFCDGRGMGRGWGW